MKNKESNCHSNKCNIWSLARKGAGNQDELADWQSVVMWLRLRYNNTCDIALQITDPSSCQRGPLTIKIKKVIVTQIDVTSGHSFQKGQDTKTNGRLTVGRNVTSTSTSIEYLHRSPASHKRQLKGNPVPGSISGSPCSWRTGPLTAGRNLTSTSTSISSRLRDPGIWENRSGDEPRGTWNREGLLWRGPAATVNYRPILSSERAPNINKRPTV
jgi:hypothetical protein